MNKQLIKDISQDLVDKFELDKKQANNFVESMFHVLQEGLQNEKIVKIKGLGTFKVISVQSRKSVDVNTGEPILIDGRDKISFTPDSDMRDHVNRPFSQFETVAVNDGTDFSLIDKKFAQEEQEDSDDTETKDEKREEGKEEDKDVKEQYTDTEGSDIEDNSLSEEEFHPVEVIPTEQDVEPQPQSSSHNEDNPQDPSSGNNEQQNQETPAKDTEVIEPESNDGEKYQDLHQEPDEPEQEVSQTAISDNERFDHENQQLLVANEELKSHFQHQYRILKGVITIFGIIVLLGIGGGYFLLNQLRKRDHRIEMLEILAYRNGNVQKAQGKSTQSTPASDNRAIATGQQDSTHVSASNQEAHQLQGSNTGNKTTTTTKAKSKANQPSASRQTLGSLPSSKAQATVFPSEASLLAKEAEYNKDVRIRTGAYRIVGISHTVKVRSGQTLSSISRANLGPGMECYVQAVNDGKTDFKSGDLIKIPQLEIKKRK